MRQVHRLTVLSTFALLRAASAAAATPCERLTELTLPQTTITLATAVAPGGFAPPASGLALRPGDAAYEDLPAFCRVAATLRPVSDSQIKIEIWLPPIAAWNGKFMAVGNGAQAGRIVYPSMGFPLSLGYAVASTDTGHEGDPNDASFQSHPEKLLDFGYRAVHEMAVKSKPILAEHYGNGPRLSVWNGCSTGGRQGLEDVQRYPTDFDGVIVGAPANNPRSNALRMWIAQAVHKDEASYIPPSKYAAIHRAALATCDANDGVKDGVLEDPARCDFDPQAVVCAGVDGPDCLTQPQVVAARKIYGPMVNPRTNERLFPGFAAGSELGWGFTAGAEPPQRTVDSLRLRVFKDPSWDYRQFNFDSDIALLDRESADVDAREPNLRQFLSRGGKLLHYHGWSDNLIPAQNSIDYYSSVVATLGGVSEVHDSYRLFMVPGMAHCRGGEGTDRFDLIGAMEQWLEHGRAPNSIVASRYTGDDVDRTRPLCPYPQVAVYDGSGNTDNAANFTCRVK